jgi:predicted lipoprotein with Yx(FWY)xxD motif
MLLAIFAASAPASATIAICAGPAATITLGASSGSVLPVVGNDDILVARDPSFGEFLTDGCGETLYTRTSDTPGVSTCNGQCTAVWPAFRSPSRLPGLPAAVGGSVSILTRDGRSRQVVYQELPLYYYSKDTQSGDVHGQGIGGFSVAVPVGVPQPPASPSSLVATAIDSNTIELDWSYHDGSADGAALSAKMM